MSHEVAEQELTPEERAALMFPVGAPDVALGGISIARSTIVQVDPADQDEDEDYPDAGTLHWYIYGSVTGSEHPPFLLYGDLSVRSSDWFIGATAVAMVMFRDPVAAGVQAPDAEEQLTAQLGPWLSNVLYDFAAGAAARLKVTTPECPLHIPVLTPPACGIE